MPLRVSEVIVVHRYGRNSSDKDVTIRAGTEAPALVALTDQGRRIRGGIEPGVLSIDESLFIGDEVFVQFSFQAYDAIGFLWRTELDVHDGAELAEDIVDTIGRRRDDAPGTIVETVGDGIVGEKLDLDLT